MSRFNEPVGTRRLSPCDLIAERECKGTLMNRGFANFFAKKVQKTAFSPILASKIVIFRNR